MVTYIRPSGSPITVNDAPETRALALDLGWVEQKAKKATPKAAPKKSK